jgi:phosphomannomutase
MTMNYLFDVDGTLTPHRQRMNKQFRKEFGFWVNEQQGIGDKVYLVTGSDKKKTIQQIGICLYRSVNGCYQNCGNQLCVRNRVIKQSGWEIDIEARLRILEIIEKSLWYGVATSNIEERVGMINISTVGRDCTDRQRQEYNDWDKHSLERESIAKTIREEYPELDASIGGMVSFDIYPKGKNKAQVIDDMAGETIFFGDNCQKGGNDYEISRAADFYYEVDNDKDTRNLLITVGAS